MSKQLSQLAQQNFKSRYSRKVVYMPPAQEKIEAYAKQLSEELGKETNPDCTTLEMRYELEDFIKVIATVYAKHLTRCAEKDSYKQEDHEGDRK